MPFITSIETHVPELSYSQDEILEAFLRLDSSAVLAQKKLSFVFKQSGIERRHSVLPDFGTKGRTTLYNANSWPSVSVRLATFRKEAGALGQQAGKLALDRIGLDAAAITHVIAVSCTGMYAPGLEIDLIKLLGLSANVERYAVNFMGCHALFHAIKMANAFCASSQNAKVLIVSVELCTLHFNANESDDAILANTLFADGACAIVVEDQPKQGAKAWSIAKGASVLLSGQSEESMAWNIHESGFLMRLSGQVPNLLAKEIEAVIHQFLPPELSLADLRIGFHPGGKRILDLVAKEIHLGAEALEHSFAVLRQYGNMSSATIGFVMKRFFDEAMGIGSIQNLLFAGFGPGLSIELLQIKSTHAV